MHRCLQVPEVVWTIFTKVYDSDSSHKFLQNTQNTQVGGFNGLRGDREARDALYSLTLTCKVLSDPALDLLWAFQPHLQYLLKSLPGVVIQPRPDDEDDGLTDDLAILRLTRDLRTEDIRRLRRYGQRIKILGDPTCTGVSASRLIGQDRDSLILPLLLKAAGEIPLFPNLHHINILFEEFQGLCWLPRLAISQKLTSVCLMTHREQIGLGLLECPWSNIQAVFLKNSRTITSFSISLVCHDTRDEHDIFEMEKSPSFMSLLQEFRKPACLDIPNVPIDAETLTSLSKTKTLKQLQVTLLSSVAEGYMQIPKSDKGGFSGIEDLFLHVYDQAACDQLLDTVTSRHLRSLKIVRCHTRASFWNIDDLVSHIIKQHCSATLEIIDVRTAIYEPSAQSDVSKITPTTLRSLMNLKNLKTIRISLNGQVHLDRSILGEITKAWPHLRILDLSERTWRSQYHPTITLQDLLAFTTSLPELHEVRLRVDASMRDVIYATLGDIDLSSNTEILDFCTSPISDPPKVAAFLVTGWPHLQKVQFGWEYKDEIGERMVFDLPTREEDYCESWEAVKTQLCPLLKSREQVGRAILI